MLSEAKVTEIYDMAADFCKKNDIKLTLFANSAKRIHLSEIKKVRRVTPILGNELATVLIAAICIALLVRVTLYMQRYDFISYKAKIS